MSAHGFPTTAACLLAVLMPACSTLHAQVPQLKPQEMSLNGVWTLTIGQETTTTTVPEYGVSRINAVDRRYTRQIDVPSEWQGRRIHLEFEMVNFAADVELRELPNGSTVVVGSHVGGWIPFHFDLTDHVRPGRSYELIVRVEGMNGPRIRRADWYENHPIGNQQFTHTFDGIVDNVWLRAYGQPVHIVDTFISPTLEQGGQLRLTYTLQNTSEHPQTVVVRSVASPWGNPAQRTGAEKTFPEHRLNLRPGERRDVTVVHPWSDARLWWPDDPFLYTLTTSLSLNGQVIDQETRRFGFREFKVDGKAFRFNGVVTRLRGDYLGFPGNYYMDQHRMMPDALAETYRYLKREYNFNAIRWHQRPAPGYCFDLADEIGLLIVCESAVYGRPSQGPDGRELGPMPPEVKANYLENAKTHLAAWTRIRRNHPSIIMWAPVNEMGPKYLNHQRLTFDEIESCLQVTRELAGDRPVVSHGNNFWLTPQLVARNPDKWNDWPTPGMRWRPGLQQHGNEEVISYHYPGNPPTDDRPRNENGKPWILTWDYLVNATPKPVAFGEYFQTAGYDRPNHPNHERAIWMTRWFGMWNRGLRYIDTADYRPKLVYWSERITDDLWRKENLAKSNSAVALFDRDYDEEGIRYWTSGFRMSHTTGVPESRRLWVFNDDFRGEQLTLEVRLLLDGSPISTATKTIHQPLGSNGLQTLYLVAPAGNFQLQRRVLKEGQEVFSDTLEYTVTPTPPGSRPLSPRVSWDPIR